jgi:AAA+ ATPase superfamily predicted ATPase
MTDNPFTFGNPIRDPERFFGRQDELRQVASRLLASVHESTAVVGERRSGKTSLLLHLSHPLVMERLGLDAQHYCLVYIDFQGLVDITPQRFWGRLLKKMSRAVCHQGLQEQIVSLLNMPAFDLFDLEDLFESAASAGLTTVLLLDEFEYITQNPNFKADFFGGLRGLAIHHNLPLVTATRRDLVDLCHSDEIKGSPFFNIFASVVLRPFARQEVFALVEGYTKDNDLHLSPAEIELVYQLGGGNPFFVQMAGYYLVEARLKGIAPESITQALAVDFDAQADPHFSYLWEHCSESEKITLLGVISLRRQKPSRKTLPSLENLERMSSRAQLDVPDLVKRGLLLKETVDTYRLFSPSLERWIAREILANEQEQESDLSVQDWVKTSGQELSEPVQGLLPRFKRKYWPVVSSVLREISYGVAGNVAFELLVKAVV